MNPFQLWDLFTRMQQRCGGTPNLACVVDQAIAEIDPLLRDYFTAEIRERVGEGFSATGITTVRLFEIFTGVQSCGKGNHLCMARLGFEEIDAALADTLSAAIRAVVDAPAATGPKFDPRGISTERLAEIHLAIEHYTADFLGQWGPLEQFPEIEAVIRERWLEKKFQAVRSRLHSGRELGAHFDNYRRAIEAAYSVTFAVQDQRSYPWVLAAVHFARLGLDAIAAKFERWVRSVAPQDDPRHSRWMSHFRIFRNIMGSTTFEHVNVAKTHFAESSGPVIEIFQREDRQAVLTPNNLIHELGHSLNRYGGFGEAEVGSLEHALELAARPRDRVGMGRPPFVGDMQELYYEHASVRNEEGVAIFEPLWYRKTSFEPSSYLLHDLFGENFVLWRSRYNYLMPDIQTVRVDVFVHNWGSSYNETAADAFLNWVREAFDDSTDWATFMDGAMTMVLRNAALHQKLVRDGGGVIPFYAGKGVIGEYVVGKVLKVDYYLRWVPEVPEIPEENVDAQIGFVLGPVGSSVSIYGWFKPETGPIPDDTESGSPYWLLVSTKAGQDTEHGKLVWIASNGVEFSEDEVKSTTKEIDPERLSPARPFEIDDLDIILG